MRPATRRRVKIEVPMADAPRPEVAIIVPAYNEASRIDAVLRAVTQSKLATEVIVVDDGSIDGTAARAGAHSGVTVVKLPHNMGKGGAMLEGVKSTKAPIILFIDADLVGLKAEHADSIIEPLLAGCWDMCVGVFRAGSFWSDAAQRIGPHLSGQRAIKRELFLGVPYLADIRMGVEVAINKHAKASHARITRIALRGVANYHKERKMGFIRGSRARIQMYSEIAGASLRQRKKRVRSRH